jgi:hypothetical protein
MRRSTTLSSVALATALVAAAAPSTALAPGHSPVHRDHAVGSMGAGAVPRAMGTGGALDVWFTQGSAKVNSDGSLAVTGTYTCTDDKITQAQLRIDLTAENNAEGSTGLQGPCGVTNAPWNATIVPDAGSAAFAKGVPTEAHATLTLDDSTGEESKDDAILLAQTLFLRTDAGVTLNDDGTATMSGTYGCSADAPTADITADLDDETADDDATGATVLQVPCPANNKAWSATIPRTAAKPARRSAKIPRGVTHAQNQAAIKRWIAERQRQSAAQSVNSQTDDGFDED